MQIRMGNFFRKIVLGSALLLAGMGAFFSHAQESPTQNRLQLARRYASSGQLEKALSVYGELYGEDPQIFVYEGYLDCLQQLGRYDQAEKLVRRQMRGSRLPVLLKVDLARNYILQGQKAKAESVLQEIVRKTDFSQPGLSVEELAEAIVEKTRLYAPAIDLYLQARIQAGGEKVSDRAETRRRKAGNPGGEDFDPSYFLLNAGEGSGSPLREVSSAASVLYASQLANLYRLDGRYGPMLDEYVSMMRVDPSAREEVCSRLQALLAGSGGEEAGVSSGEASKRIARQILQLVSQKAQQEPDDPVVQDLLIWTLLQERDFQAAAVQARSYSRRFSDAGTKWFETIRTIAQNRVYDLAQIQYETFIREASDTRSDLSPSLVRMSRIDLLNLYFSRLENRKTRDTVQIRQIKEAYRKLFAELGRDPETFGMHRNLARIYAYYTGERDSACRLLEQALASRSFSAQQKAQLKIDLADILLYYDKVWDATLLYSQVEKDFKQDAVGFYAKLQNARLSYYIGEFEWAQSQLDVLRAATSKLIANDAMELSLLIRENMNPDSTYEGLEKVARADLLIFRRLYRPALSLLDQVLAMPLEGALFDDVYFRKAQVCLRLDSVDAALDCLARIYTGYTDDLLADDALFMAAGLLQLRSGHAIDPETEFLRSSDFPPPDAPLWGKRSQEEKTADREEAMRLYQRIFMEYRSSALAPLARQRYRQLRGN